MCVCSVTWSCPTLWDPLDCSLLVSSVHDVCRQGYWDELPFPPPGDLLDPRIKLESFASPALQTDFYHSAIREAPTNPIDAYI